MLDVPRVGCSASPAGARRVRQARVPDLPAGRARARAPGRRDGAHGLHAGGSGVPGRHAHRRRSFARVLLASRDRDGADAAPRPRRRGRRARDRLAARRMGGPDRHGGARRGAPRMAAGLRVALGRSRPPGRAARALRGLATTMPVGPVIVVNGPIRHAIGMNSGINVFGQGNRANLTIGRALQLVVRNVGGGRPGEVDRATFGNPGKIAFCFAEDEESSPWPPLAADFGARPGTDAVVLFTGEGPRSIVDQQARDPESLARTLAANLRTLHHPKLVMVFDCLLAIGPEHARVFREAGWSKQALLGRLQELLQVPGRELVRGAGGMAEGVPESLASATLPKFRPNGLRLVHCGGRAGLLSVMLGGWAGGALGSEPVMSRSRNHGHP